MSSEVSRLLQLLHSHQVRCSSKCKHTRVGAPFGPAVQQCGSPATCFTQLRNVATSTAVELPASAAEPAAELASMSVLSAPADTVDGLQTGRTRFVAETKLPTRTGSYRVRAYKHTVAGKVTEPMCIMTGRPEGLRDVVVRVHDACFTSEVLGSLKCDCAEQLQLAMGFIQDCPPGIIVYLQQEGRGIGLANKIAAYALQEEGYDTVDANRQLGFDDDCREYSSVRNILHDLGISSIKLMTNNPRKINILKALGVDITERIPCIVDAQEYSRDYLDVKASRMSHVLDGPKLDGSFCYWNHSGDSPASVNINGSSSNGNGSSMSDITMHSDDDTSSADEAFDGGQQDSDSQSAPVTVAGVPTAQGKPASSPSRVAQSPADVDRGFQDTSQQQQQPGT